MIAATAAIAATGGTAALAFTGEPGTGAPPTSDAPDLVSATITRVTNPTSPLGPQVRVCYDEIVQSFPNPNFVGTLGYDSEIGVQANNLTLDNTDNKCAIATFPLGVDIEQATALVNGQDAVADSGGATSPTGTAPLEGTKVTPVAGRTTAPDLIGTTVDAGATPPQITYTFDENLDPGLSGGGAQLAAKFGFYIDSDNGNAPRLGTGIAGVDGPSIVVQFANVTSAKYFFVNNVGPGAFAQDRVCTGACNGVGGPGTITPTRSPIGSFGPAITGGPTLVSAAKQAGSGGQIVDLTLSQASIPGAVGAGSPPANVEVYRADADIMEGTYAIGTSGANTSVLPLTLPAAAQEEPTSVVRVGLRPGVIRNQANNRDNPFGHAAIDTEPARKGYTDGPDLIRTTVDDATDRVSYEYDEPILQPLSGALFSVLNPDGTSQFGDAAGVVLSSDKKFASVKFSGGVTAGAVAGVAVLFGAVADTVPDQVPLGIYPTGNLGPFGNVGLTAIACQPGTCPTVTPTPTATQPPVTPTPTPTQPPNQTVNVKTKVTIKRKAKGKKFTGKVQAAAPCKAGRTVKVKGKSTKSKANGSYSVSFKKKVKGKVSASVPARTIRRGTTTFRCSAAKSKKV